MFLCYLLLPQPTIIKPCCFVGDGLCLLAGYEACSAVQAA
jgi:hypothetical protein